MSVGLHNMFTALRQNISILSMTAWVFLACNAVGETNDLDWPQYGHDRQLTGRTSVKGDIAVPRVAWSLSLAGTELDIEVTPSDTNSTTVVEEQNISLPEVAIESENLGSRSESLPFVQGSDERWVDILPDKKNLQKIVWSRPGTRGEIARLQLFSYENGIDKPKLEWESKAESTIMRPLCLVYDIDKDGVKEICVAVHYRILIYEGTTGRLETELEFHSSRSYGWFGLSDVDEDTDMEFVLIADFQSHIDVLDFNPAIEETKRLSVKWRREINKDIEMRDKWPQVGPSPLVDVLGDNRPEMVINLFNDLGDGQWHVNVLDPISGDTLHDLTQCYLHGSGDVDGDGKHEVFVSATNDAHIPGFSEIKVISLKDSPKTIWSQSLARFLYNDVMQDNLRWSTSATQGLRHVTLSDHLPRPVFFTLAREANDPNSTKLTAIRFNQGGEPVTLWDVSGLPDHISSRNTDGFDESASLTIRAQIPRFYEGKFEANKADLKVVKRAPAGTGPFSPIVTNSNDGEAMIVIQGAAEQLYAIKTLKEERSVPSIEWQLPGRGIGNEALPGTTLAVELDGKSPREIVFASQALDGSAVLNACRADGTSFWRHKFEKVNGSLPKLNENALLYWWAGRFRDRDYYDILVNTRRGLMHSESGHLLDGRSGNKIWSQVRAAADGQFTWGYCGGPVASADLLDTGQDQIVNLFPVCYWLGDGKTGLVSVGKELSSQKILPAWAAYGEPIVYDFNNDGKKEVLLDSPYILAMLKANGDPLWHGKPVVDYPTGLESDNVGEATRIRHAVLDLDGDGYMEIASGGYRDGIRAIDPSDGTILWSLDIPQPNGSNTPFPTGKCAAADINGDGGDELILVVGSDLIAVTGNREKGSILWTWHGPEQLSLPAIADVDSDGKAEIVVQSADGIVHCIDGPNSRR